MLEQLAALDPYALAGFSIAFLLAACVVIIFSMRDPESSPPRMVSRSVWCAERRQRAAVDFVERIQTGLPIRTVQRCSLRGSGERCNEDCCDLPCSEMQPRFTAAAVTLPARA